MKTWLYFCDLDLVFKDTAEKIVQIWPFGVGTFVFSENYTSFCCTFCFVSSYPFHFIDLYLGRDGRKPVFGVSDKARIKPVYSATETS